MNFLRSIPALLFIVCLLMPCSIIKAQTANAKTTFNLAVMHSYDKQYPAYKDFNKLLIKTLKEKGLHADINFFYLDCEQYDNIEELERCYNYVESLRSWRPDIIVTIDDQVTYSLLACEHPLAKTLPIIFSGVNFPNWSSLKNFNNVTGFWDKPDYQKNVEMIEELLGKTRIRFLYDNTYLGKQVIREIAKQLKDKDKATSDILTDFVNTNDSVITARNFARDAAKKSEYIARPDSTTFYFSNLRDEKGRDVLWAISGYVQHAVFVLTKYDYRTMRVGRMASIPLFSVINEGMGYDYGILGGYVTTTDIQADEITDYISKLAGGTPINKLPIVLSSKKFVIDYKEAEHWNISLKDIPKNYEILNMPFYIKYHTLVIILSILLLVAFISFIAYPLFLYIRENKRKREAQLNYIREKEILSFALEGSNIYVWKYLNDSDEFLLDNEFFEDLDIPAQTFSLAVMYDMMHPDEREDASDTFIKVRNRVILDKTRRCRCNFNGRGYLWYEIRYVSPAGALLNTASIIGLIKNIQDFKEREEELTTARDLAAQAELKQSFLANMSHEIRTPLNAIVGFSNILAESEYLSQEEKNEFIGTINSNCELLLKLINDILEISRIESGNMSFVIVPCNLNSLLEDIYMTHSLLIPRHLDFTKKIPTEQIIINTDSSRLNQVITNFLNNATKFTSTGCIELGCVANKFNNEISIYVEDTGKGIPEEEQKMIFERFYKQDEFAQGTGLGLSISMIIAEKLGGKITLHSTVGKGSRFAIILPYS